jgi:hypothetical protein
MDQSALPVANARVTIAALTNTAQAVFTSVASALGQQVILGFLINGGAAAEVVIFRATDDSPEYFRVNIGAGGFALHEQPFCIAMSEGLEVITASAAGDVEVTVFYYVPGALGLGV